MDIQNLKSNGRVVVKSQIDGDFEGFDDEKLFPLSNGQYWIQTEYKYWYHYAYMPRIQIIQLNGAYFITVDGQDQFVQVNQVTDVIEATIVNDFNGWKGDTIFELDNGQIWKQNEYDYEYNYSYRPTAIIYSNGFRHKILVEGKSVEVKRIK